MKKTIHVKDAFLIALALLLIAAVSTAARESMRAKRLADEADAAVRRAMYQSADLLGGLQGTLLKLPASSGGVQEQLLLGDVARLSFGVQEHLAALPAGVQQLQGALKFANQIQDYADTLTGRLARGGSLSEEDRRQLLEMADASVQLQAQLLGSADTLTPIDFDAPSIESGTNEDGPSVEYPTLIYDGPFSDGQTKDPILPADAQVYDVKAAEAAAAAFVGGERMQAIRLAREMQEPVSCYEFEIDREDDLLTVCIAKAGGRTLYMLSERIPGTEKYTQEECIDRAAEFLLKRGYGDMQPTFCSAVGGFCTINFAAVQEGVLLYPDLVKAEVAMDSGEICGIEARNYLANHRLRTDLQPSVPLDEAQKGLNERLEVTGSRLCVIPTDPGEALAWEFSAEIDGVGSYLIYIDAMTGKELNILRLVETETGLEAQ